MQLKLHMVTIEYLVPENHFLRKLQSALDLSFVYEMTAPFYSKKFGSPPIDPVVLVKYLLAGFCTVSRRSGKSNCGYEARNDAAESTQPQERDRAQSGKHTVMQ